MGFLTNMIFGPESEADKTYKKYMDITKRFMSGRYSEVIKDLHIEKNEKLTDYDIVPISHWTEKGYCTKCVYLKDIKDYLNGR